MGLGEGPACQRTTPNRRRGEELVKKDLITREDLDKAKANEAATGTPWYKQLVQSRLVSFQALEEVLRYEFHPKALREEHHTLGHTLVDMGAISEQQLVKALAEQKRNGRLLGSILLEWDQVTHDVIGRALARQNNLEYADLATTPSRRDALEAVPESMAQKNEVLPIQLEGDKLTLLVVSPQTASRLHHLSVLLGKRLHAILTASDDFKAEVSKRYKILREEPGNGTGKPAPPVSSAKAAPAEKPAKKSATKKEAPMATPEITTEAKNAAREGKRFDEIARQASGASVVKMVQTIIEGAVNSGATDIHLDPQEPEMRVRYRIDGILHDVMSIPENLETAVVSRIKILADLDITETRRPQDGHIRSEIGDQDYDIRVATLPCYLGERVVMRLLDQSSILHGIKDLGLDAEDEKRLTKLIEQPYGMILVTGPTGSGKTTTLYACLNQKNVMTDSIVTLEDPVEYQLSGINQVQIETDIGVTFATTLRRAPAGHRRLACGRDSRRGNRAYRGARSHDRPPGLQHATHERRPRGRRHAAEHGCAVVSHRQCHHGGHRPTPGAHDLPQLPRQLQAQCGYAQVASACPPPPRSFTAAKAATYATRRATAAAPASSKCWRSPRRFASCSRPKPL
jgi:hypothetical protein